MRETGPQQADSARFPGSSPEDHGFCVIRRRQGYEFNPYFAPVILLTAWLGSVLAERELVDMIWVVLAVGVLGVGAHRLATPAPAPIPG